MYSFYYFPLIILVLEYIIICNALSMEQNTYIGSNAK